MEIERVGIVVDFLGGRGVIVFIKWEICRGVFIMNLKVFSGIIVGRF